MAMALAALPAGESIRLRLQRRHVAEIRQDQRTSRLSQENKLPIEKVNNPDYSLFMNEPQSKATNSDKNQFGSQVTSTSKTSSSSEAKTINELSPEEQMALYEKELKENDWGHQPC